MLRHPAVADPIEPDNGECACLQVQSPDPRAILAGPQILVEAQQPRIQQSPMIDPSPRVWNVHGAALRGRTDARACRADHPTRRMADALQEPLPTVNLHVVGRAKRSPALDPSTRAEKWHGAANS